LIGETEDKLTGAAPGDEEPAWIGYFSPAELAAQAGYCWQLIGEHQRAAAYAEQAVRDLGTRFSRAVQFNFVHKATAQLGLGELEEALDSARAAVPMANALTSRRSVEMVKAFDKKLAPYSGERQVRDWRDYLRTELHAAAS
jgi:tetratricopeptide (TPR) repeat protein